VTLNLHLLLLAVGSLAGPKERWHHTLTPESVCVQ
jgi:hypothetical protein